MTNNKYKGTYGLYNWHPLHGEHLIGSQYLDCVKKMDPRGLVFLCVDENDEYIKLKYGDIVFDAKPDLYEIVENPAFNIGDDVEVVSSGAVGHIHDMFWHYKEKQPLYFLTVEGKKKSRRFFTSELRALHDTGMAR